MESIKFLRRWRKVRRLGKVYYIFGYMFLVSFAVLAGNLAVYYIMYKTLTNFNLDRDMLGILVVCSAGVALGTFRWERNERKYKGLS